MQWEKFKQFSATHLELAPCLIEQLQSIGGRRTMRDIVERQLEYIAVRPWESLNLDEAGHSQRCPGGEESVTYTVYAHIEGKDGACTRARASYRRDDSTIRELINELATWHTEYWAKQDDRPLVFDAVTRKSACIHYDERDSSLDRKALSFFLFPEGFTA